MAQNSMIVSDIVMDGIRDTLESFSCFGIINGNIVDQTLSNVVSSSSSSSSSSSQIDVFSLFVKLNLPLLHTKLGLIIIMQNIFIPVAAAEVACAKEFFIPTFCETKHLSLIYDPNLYLSDEVPLITLFTYKFICDYMYRTSK